MLTHVLARWTAVVGLIATALPAGHAVSPDLTWVGGAPMFPTRTIYQNLIGSGDHTRLLDAIETGGLATTLDGERSYTVFAPTNSAFAALKGADRAPRLDGRLALQTLVGHHVVPGRLTTARLLDEAARNDGVVRYATVSRSVLTVRADDDGLWVVDAGGRRTRIAIADVRQANGVVHVINAVLRPD